jgi:uncharacterized protein YcbX
MPGLGRIVVYPIKSLDGIAVSSSRFVAGGGLEHDRAFAIRDNSGKIVTAKRFAGIHRLTAEFDLQAGTVRLAASAGDTEPPPPGEFRLSARNPDLEAWLGAFFGFEVTVDENRETGFPDDLDSPGPTVIGRPTLEAVARWFAPLDLAETRRRFRANLEFETAPGDPEPLPPFWEDRLFDADASPDALATVGFRVGEVRFEGTNPCARCAVPARDSHTGEAWPRFAQEFQAHRAAALPAWAPPTAFDHFYRLAVNTRVPASEVGKQIQVGDKVTM